MHKLSSHWRRIFSEGRPEQRFEVGPLNALDPDPGDNPSKESQMATHLQQDNFELPWAIYMQAKIGHETPGNVKRLQNDQQTKEIRKAGRELRLESINTNQVARVNKATIRSELSSMRWHTEMPADQGKRPTPCTKGGHKTTKTHNKIVKLTIHNRQNNNERVEKTMRQD